jgi:PAS domain S-box-containing protein
LLLALSVVLAWIYWSIKRSDRQSRDALTSLAQSESRFRSLTQLSADWYWEQDEQFRVRFLSSEAGSKAGRSLEAQHGLARWDIAGVDLSSADWDAHKAICAAHEPFRDFIYRRFGDDGTAYWISVSGEPLFDERGTFKGYRGIGSDITAQKRAEQEFIRRKDLYAALSQTNRAIIHIHDQQALFDEICRVAVEHGHLRLVWIGLLDNRSGWLQPKAVHGPVSHLYKNIRVSIDETVPEGRGFAAQAMRDGTHYIVNDFFSEPRVIPWLEQARASGIKSLATFPLFCNEEVVGVLNVHGDEIGFFTDDLIALLQEMAHNISYALANMQRDMERATAQHALLESETRFRQLAANVPGVFWSALPGGGLVTYVSPAYDRMSGRSSAVLFHEPGDWLEAVHRKIVRRWKRRCVKRAPDGSITNFASCGRTVRCAGFTTARSRCSMSAGGSRCSPASPKTSLRARKMKSCCSTWRASIT